MKSVSTPYYALSKRYAKMATDPRISRELLPRWIAGAVLSILNSYVTTRAGSIFKYVFWLIGEIGYWLFLA